LSPERSLYGGEGLKDIEGEENRQETETKKRANPSQSPWGPNTQRKKRLTLPFLEEGGPLLKKEGNELDVSLSPIQSTSKASASRAPQVTGKLKQKGGKTTKIE